MDASELVLRDGDRVRASGRIVAVGGTAWFEPPLPVPAAYCPPERQPPPRPSGLGVPAIGVDLSHLQDRREKQGAVEGWATLTGTWQQDQVLVVRQDPPSSAPDQSPGWRRPPCPTPAGGWPEGEVDENIDLPPDMLTTYAITSVAMFRPSRRQTILVVAAEEPQRVEAALRPRYGARLCVVPSRWSRREIEGVLGRLRVEMRPWLIYMCGESVGEDGQAVVTADLTRVLPALAAWANTVPDGLLSLNPWLTPQGGRAARKQPVVPS